MPDDNQPNQDELTASNEKPLVPIRELFGKIQKPLEKVAGHVFAEIEKIHWLHQLGTIDLVQVNADNYDGEYEYYKMGRGIKIKISSRAANKEFALLHEIGHFIDNQAFGTKGVNESEAAGGALSEVLKAINKTDAIRYLHQMQKTGKYELMGRVRKLTHKQILDIEYLLTAREKWARAYAQYITLKTNNELLVQQLNWEINASEIIPTHWKNDAFKNIIFAIDNLLNKKKWSKLI